MKKEEEMVVLEVMMKEDMEMELGGWPKLGGRILVGVPPAGHVRGSADVGLWSWVVNPG